jgi:iron complex outermembrane receptor protein
MLAIAISSLVKILRMKHTLSLLLILLGFLPTWAQKGLVKGKITDANTKEGLIGATIQSGDNAASSDESGNFSLELNAGSHTLEISFLGYETVQKSIVLQANQTLELSFALGESATILQTTTITSSRFEKPLSDVVVSLEVVAPKLIENTNSIALNEVLDKVPGVNMLDDQADIRGGAGYAQGTGSRVMILMDDMPVLQADAGLALWRDLPTENVSQIEVLKGAASCLYGSAAMNGIINIRTAYPTSKPFTKISLFGKAYDSPRNPDNKWWNGSNAPYEAGLQAAHRQRFGKLDVVAGTNIFFNRGFMRGYRTDTFLGPVDSLPNYDHKGRFTTNLRYRYSERLIFGLNFNLNFGEQNRHLFWTRNLGQSLYEAAQESVPIRGKNFRFTLDPSVTYYDGEGNRHRLQTRYFRIVNNNENLQSNSSNYVYGEYQFQRRFENLGKLELVAGIVGAHNAVVAEVYGNESFATSNAAAYLQLEKKFFERLSVSAGVRYEYNSINPKPDSIRFGLRMIEAPDDREGKPVFRIGTNYKITEGTFLRASWGQAYRFPTLLEKYVSTSAGVLGVYPNPSLSSETGWSAEVGIKQGFKIKQWQGFLDVSIFRSEYQNMMEFQFAPSIFGFWVQNVGDTRITGIDASVAGQGKIGAVSIDLIGGYTYINPMFQNFDSTTQENSSSDINTLKYRFRHTAKADVQLGYKGFGLGFTGQYMSFMEAIDNYLNVNFPTISNFRDEHNKGTLLFNVRASYQWKQHIKVSFLVQNALNQEYSIRPGLLEAPRNFTLRTDFSF